MFIKLSQHMQTHKIKVKICTTNEIKTEENCFNSLTDVPVTLKYVVLAVIMSSDSEHTLSPA